MQTIQDNFSYNADTSILFTTHVTSRHVTPSYYYYYIIMTAFEGKFVITTHISVTQKHSTSPTATKVYWLQSLR
jgi:hypothetical protein